MCQPSCRGDYLATLNSVACRVLPIAPVEASGAASRPWPLCCANANPQAKKFVESVPQTLKENVPKEEAEKLMKTLQDLGATVTMS